MSFDNFSMKELYDVTLKATYNLEIGNRTFEEGEVITEFDKIILSNFQEVKSHIEARGGFDNRAHVNWDETKEVLLSFSQGVFSSSQFALLSNSKLLVDGEEEEIIISKKEELESSESGYINLTYPSFDKKVFVYDKNGEKVEGDLIGNQRFYIGQPYKDVIVRYNYKYDNGARVIKVGRRLIEGYLRLEGKTHLKDDNTGQVVTGLIIIPRLKLMSDLSMRLGTEANPVVANFQAKGYPVGERGNKTVIDFVILNDDIDADI